MLAFYMAASLLVFYYAWTQNINHQISAGNNPIYRNLMDCPAYIRQSFGLAEIQKNPFADSKFIRGEAFDNTWFALKKSPPKVRNSSLPGLPGRPVISPGKGTAEEFTIIIPVEMDSKAISFLNDNPSVIPGILFKGIGENWEIYFNGTLMLSEIHQEQYDYRQY